MEFQTQLSCVLLSFSSSDIFSNKFIFHFLFVPLSFLLRISFPFMFCKLWVLWLHKNTIVSVEVNVSIYYYIADWMIYLWLDNELDRKIYVTAILFLLVQNRQQTLDWTLIGSGANGLGILEWESLFHILLFIYFYFLVVSWLHLAWISQCKCHVHQCPSSSLYYLTKTQHSG